MVADLAVTLMEEGPALQARPLNLGVRVKGCWVWGLGTLNSQPKP